LCEIMVMTKAIAKLIQTDQTHQIPTQLQMGRDLGMQLLDQALLAAITATEIDPDDAYAYARRSAVPEVRDRHQHAAETRRHGDRARASVPGRIPPFEGPRRHGNHRRIPLRGLDKRGSDLHFIAGDPPRIRLYGDLGAAPGQARREFVKEALYEIMPKPALDRFESKDGADFAYTLGDRGRFRVNVMRQLNGMGACSAPSPPKRSRSMS
jgi:Tfp pilus assembly pilus retraction ATPase PilT